jgi:peptidoglycan/LPS O-acetylase OafA/YrhL
MLEDNQTKSISHNLSLYLDFLRFSAALAVFFAHANNFILPNRIALYGQESVAVFFVLSGFVISYVVSKKETDWRNYTIARMARIFPVAVLTIILTIVVDKIGLSVNPSHYAELNDAFGGFFKNETFFSAAVSLMFLNQIWFSHVVFGTAEPYWSLGFEVQYYIFFGIISFLSRKKLVVALCIWSAICGPKIIMYLPLWLIGVVCQQAADRDLIKSRKLALFILYGSSMMFLSIWKIFRDDSTTMFETYLPTQELINFIYFTSLGAMAALNILAFNTLFKDVILFPRWLAKTIQWLAGGSFTLYLLHQPIMVMLSSFAPIALSDRGTGLVATVFAFLLLFALAEIAERRKSFFAILFGRLLHMFCSKPTSHIKAGAENY